MSKVTTSVPSQGSASRRQYAAWRELLRRREVGVLAALLLLCLVLAIASPVFLHPANLLNIGRQVALLGIMAVGMTFVIVSGEIDLSVGSIYGLCGVLAGLMIMSGQSIWLAIIGGVLAGGAVGLFNGVVSTYGRLPSFIVTLGTLSIARGIALITSGGLPISLNAQSAARSDLAPFFWLAQGQLLGMPMQFVWLVLIAALGIVLLSATRFGFHIYAIGGSPRAALVTGINLFRVKIIAFVLLGLLCGWAGVLNLAFLENIQSITGTGIELDVIAAVIIGGTSLRGGEGTIQGTLIGALIIGVLRNGLVLLGIPPFWQVTAIGVVVIVAVAIDKWFTSTR